LKNVQNPGSYEYWEYEFSLPPWGGVSLSALGMLATIWSIVPARDDKITKSEKQSVEWELSGETEVREENLP
jgi:hypothetical protein